MEPPPVTLLLLLARLVYPLILNRLGPQHTDSHVSVMQTMSGNIFNTSAETSSNLLHIMRALKCNKVQLPIIEFQRDMSFSELFNGGIT